MLMITAIRPDAFLSGSITFLVSDEVCVRSSLTPYIGARDPVDLDFSVWRHGFASLTSRSGGTRVLRNPFSPTHSTFHEVYKRYHSIPMSS